MKRLKELMVISLFFAFSGVFLSSCSDSSSENTSSALASGVRPDSLELLSPVGKILAGEHKLRKLFSVTKESNTWSASGGFFLLLGGFNASGQSSKAPEVMFAWQMNDSIYKISRLPFERLRIQIKDNILVPTIRFAWEGFTWENHYPRGINTEEKRRQFYEAPYNPFLADKAVGFIKWAVITCKQTDWPPQISLPLNQPPQVSLD